jgi:hypothetical protein
MIASPSISFRAFSAWELQPVLPGPMAQAFTFRAFGAETRESQTAQHEGGGSVRFEDQSGMVIE